MALLHLLIGIKIVDVSLQITASFEWITIEERRKLREESSYGMLLLNFERVYGNALQTFLFFYLVNL